jgi:hypothetical protein
MECPKLIQDHTKTDDSEWVFDLLEKIFNEEDLSTEEVKENGMSQANPGENRNV